jgi:hypothetical protein
MGGCSSAPVGAGLAGISRFCAPARLLRESKAVLVEPEQVDVREEDGAALILVSSVPFRGWGASRGRGGLCGAIPLRRAGVMVGVVDLATRREACLPAARERLSEEVQELQVLRAPVLPSPAPSLVRDLPKGN